MRGKGYSSVSAVPAQIILDICLTPQRRQRPGSQTKRLLELVTHPALDRTQPRRTKNPPKTSLQVTSRNTQTRKYGNKLLDVIHEFESWSGLRISIPKSVVTGAMYGTGTTRRQEGAKADAAKRKREAGPDILNILDTQIRALEAMDEALDRIS